MERFLIHGVNWNQSWRLARPKLYALKANVNEFVFLYHQGEHATASDLKNARKCFASNSGTEPAGLYQAADESLFCEVQAEVPWNKK